MVVKKSLTDDALINIYKAYLKGGVAEKDCLLKGIMENVNCTLPVAYRILNEHNYLFQYNEKNKTFHLFSSYYFNPEEFRSEPNKFEQVGKFLDKVVFFVSKRPYSDDFLILVDTLRDQLADGILENLDKMCIMLNQKFGEEAKSLVDEGEMLRKPPAKVSDNSGSKSEPKSYEETHQNDYAEEAD